MIKIEKGNMQIAERLVTFETCPSFSGILCGNSAGKIWVDEIENPHFAIVYSAPVGSFGVLGRVKNDIEYNLLVEFIQNELFQQLKESGETDFEFSADDLELEQRLLKTFEKNKIVQDQEIYFVYENKKPTINIPIKNYSFRQVDKECIEEDFKNKEFLMDKIFESWGTAESYLKMGVAFIATNENKIIGIIMGSSNYNDVLPIDIEIIEEYRQLGIASELTKYFLNYCFEQRKVAYWNCITSNIASQRLAEKAGFKCIGKNYYYYFSM
ncbi:GNAT family N-acetyltransferase [Anaerosporobacter sp.]|uniref:GNAT family N-acetyltransferase n=1 Tax=Anaerosporobacter sp. TaxID=1872529 RepID=UPI00286FA09A|nr:GNAT family N-acetyltransferase [Anaerosporobacter sp.]